VRFQGCGTLASEHHRPINPMTFGYAPKRAVPFESRSSCHPKRHEACRSPGLTIFIPCVGKFHNCDGLVRLAQCADGSGIALKRSAQLQVDLASGLLDLPRQEGQLGGSVEHLRFETSEDDVLGMSSSRGVAFANSTTNNYSYFIGRSPS
jgi:hypothetical protein